jgi:hypothetical protein
MNYENECIVGGGNFFAGRRRVHLVDCLLQTLNPPDATHAEA